MHTCLALLLLLILTFCSSLLGDIYLPKDNNRVNRVICLNATTGDELWLFKPPALSDAHFALYSSRLAVYPYLNLDNPLFLDPKKGETISTDSEPLGPVLAKSQTFSQCPKIRFDNKWSLVNFDPGNTMVFTFASADTGNVEWRILADDFAESYMAYKDVFCYATYGAMNQPAIVAYRIGGTTPIWTRTLDSFARFLDPSQGAGIQPINGNVFAQKESHILELSIDSGEVLLHLDICKDLNLRHHEISDVFNMQAGFAVTGAILIISFQKCVIAYDLKARRYLWYLYPDTFPHIPFPVAFDSSVWLTAGDRRILHRIAKTHWTDYLRPLLNEAFSVASKRWMIDWFQDEWRLLMLKSKRKEERLWAISAIAGRSSQRTGTWVPHNGTVDDDESSKWIAFIVHMLVPRPNRLVSALKDAIEKESKVFEKTATSLLNTAVADESESVKWRAFLGLLAFPHPEMIENALKRMFEAEENGTKVEVASSKSIRNRLKFFAKAKIGRDEEEEYFREQQSTEVLLKYFKYAREVWKKTEDQYDTSEQ